MTEYIPLKAVKEAVHRIMEPWPCLEEDIYDLLDEIPSAGVVSAQDYRDCRNELCLKCGQYQTKHLGSCNGCRWERI